MQIMECESKTVTGQLTDLGEGAALGFYEALAENLPWPRTYGRAYRRLYENIGVKVYDHHLLIPCEPLENSRNERTHHCHHAESLIVDFMHHNGLHVNQCIVEEKQEKYPEAAGFISSMAEDMQRRLPHFAGYTHTNPDIRRVVTEGFDAMEAELDHEIATVRREQECGEASPDEERQRELNLLLCLKDYCIGVRTWHGNAVCAAKEATLNAKGPRREKLAQISAALENALLKPATTFIEGLLSVHMTWLLDGCDSIGRVDQALGTLFENDLDAGRISLTFARELIDDFFAYFEEMNGWNLTVGGRRPEGPDGCNRLTEEIILACERNKLRRPNVAFRINKDTPTALIDLALQGLARGSGRPALYNDDLYIDTLLNSNLGLSKEDAREFTFGGCTETMIGGLSNVGSLDGTINLAACLERTLFDGACPMREVQEGPHTGLFTEFATYEEFENALKRQIIYATDAHVGGINGGLKQRFTQGDPKPYRTFFTRDCVQNRKGFESGGARYNWSVVSYHGTSNLIDSLEVIEELVYKQQVVSPAELLCAIQDDFSGHEALRKRLLAAAKFGNDAKAVDQRGAKILDFAWKELSQHETPRGGRYLPSTILFTTYASAGRPIGATPDGRLAGTALNDSIGAAQGRDINGPTSLLKSVTTLPLTKAIGTPVLNLRFQRSVIDSEPGRKGIAALLNTYFAEGGLQMQVSVLDREELLAAQKDPETHADLIVRMGGYSEFFTRLDPALQESVMARTEHGG